MDGQNDGPGTGYAVDRADLSDHAAAAPLADTATSLLLNAAAAAGADRVLPDDAVTGAAAKRVRMPRKPWEKKPQLKM